MPLRHRSSRFPLHAERWLIARSEGPGGVSPHGAELLVVDAIIPASGPTSLEFLDKDPRPGVIGGLITMGRAHTEDDVMSRRALALIVAF